MKKTKRKNIPRGMKKRGPKIKWQSILEGVPKESPSLLRAYELTLRASRVGFDWPNMEGVLKKLDEELGEFREAMLLQHREKACEEMGDLLFVLVNVSRFLRINPEKALKKTLEKFISRFHYIERTLSLKGKTPQQSPLTEMDRLWEESKKRKKFKD